MLTPGVGWRSWTVSAPGRGAATCPSSTYRSPSFAPMRPICPSRPTSTGSGRRPWPRPGLTTSARRSRRSTTAWRRSRPSTSPSPGFGGSPIRGWLHLPAGRGGPIPAVVEYIGYGGGRGLAHERILWAAAGYAHFVMDTRGQGSEWARRRHAGPRRDGPAGPSRVHDPGDPRSGHVLLPARLHRRRPGGRGGPQPPRRRPGPGRGHRVEPGRRPRAWRPRASPTG